MAKEIAGNKVQLVTFLNWSFGDCIGYETKVKDGREMVISIHCKVCARHIDKIKTDSKLKGKVQNEVEIFAMGTKNVKKHAVTRHLGGSGHHAAVDYDKLLGSGPSTSEVCGVTKEGGSGDTSTSGRADGGTGSGTQPRIDASLHKASRDAYRRLIKTAYRVAIDGLPLRTFTSLVNIQKDNGVQLISGCDGPDRAAEFIHLIATSEREAIKNILDNTHCFSVLSDGSQARKTDSEKELVFIRVVFEGSPLYLCVALQDMDVYGAANAENLKTAIDDVFLKTLKITEAHYVKALVCAAADGAAVNTGAFNGLLVRLAAEREWIVNIHCISHRVELAVKDSLLDKANKTFSNIQQFLISMYYMFKKSPKVNREVKATADALGVHVYKLKKVHGTRFVNHQRVGVKALLSDWAVLAISFENTLAKNNTTQKLPGMLRKLKSVEFLVQCATMKSLLDTISTLSLMFERGEVMAFEVLYNIEKTIGEIDALVEEKKSVDDILRDVGIEYDEGGIIRQKLPKKGHNRRKPQNREYTTVEYSGMYKEGNSEDIVRSLKNNVFPKVGTFLKERFGSFNGDVYKSMMWLDPANWDEDDDCAELDQLRYLAQHFDREGEAYKVYEDKLKREWKDLKRAVRIFYCRLKMAALWKKLMKYRKHEFPNICKLAEIVMSIGPSNSTVEAGFSHLTMLLSDRRLLLKHQTMEDLLIVKVNNLVFSQSQIDDIIESALDMFMSKKRKLQLSNQGENGAGKRQKVQSEVDSDDDVDVEKENVDTDRDEIIDSDSDMYSDAESGSESEAESESISDSERENNCMPMESS